MSNVNDNISQKKVSPIGIRNCKCCGLPFQPKRVDQIFYNKKHADYYNYHNVKKPKQRIQNTIEKIHRKNDRICARYVNANGGNPIITYWEAICADGFNDQYIQGTCTKDNKTYTFTYNHMYTIIVDNGIVKIKIEKR